MFSKKPDIDGAIAEFADGIGGCRAGPGAAIRWARSVQRCAFYVAPDSWRQGLSGTSLSPG